MRVVFLGSPKEVIRPLEILLESAEENNFEVVGVVSQPARPVGRKRVLTDPPVAQFAKKQGLPTFQPAKASDPDFLKELKALKVDICVTAAYGQILSEEFLKIPSRATINIHPSLLPKYRGASPIQSALANGEKETGVSILFTVKAMDAGAIILQEKSEIASHECSHHLLKRFFDQGGKMTVQAIEMLRDKNFKGTEQDPNEITHCKKFRKEDGEIDWSLSGSEIYNRFKAFHPWPGSYTFLDGERQVIEHMETPTQEDDNSKNGFFKIDNQRRFILARVKDGWLKIASLKPAGGKSLNADAYFNRVQSKNLPNQFTGQANE